MQLENGCHFILFCEKYKETRTARFQGLNKIENLRMRKARARKSEWLVKMQLCQNSLVECYSRLPGHVCGVGGAAIQLYTINQSTQNVSLGANSMPIKSPFVRSLQRDKICPHHALSISDEK